MADQQDPVALYAAVVSSLTAVGSLVWNIHIARRDRAVIKVELSLGYGNAHPGQPPAWFVSVTVSNRGRRPVTFRPGLYSQRRKGQTFIWLDGQEVKLEEGQGHTWAIPAADCLPWPADDPLKKVWIVDATNQRYYAKVSRALRNNLHNPAFLTGA